MVFSPVIVLCHSNIVIRRLIHNTIMKVEPDVHIIDVDHWSAVIQIVQHMPITAIVAETPATTQRVHVLHTTTALHGNQLPIVLLDTEASALSILAVATFAVSVSTMDELREAVMDLGRNDVDDIGVAIMVSRPSMITKRLELSY